MDLNADRLGSDAQRPAFFTRATSQSLCLQAEWHEVLGKLAISGEFGWQRSITEIQ